MRYIDGMALITYLDYAVVFANLAVIIAMAPRRNDLSLGFATLARTIMMLQALGMAPKCDAPYMPQF